METAASDFGSHRERPTNHEPAYALKKSFLPATLSDPYVLAALCTVFSIMLTHLIDQMGHVSTVLVYLAAVVACSSVAGFRSGVITLVASLVAAFHDMVVVPGGMARQDLVRYLVFIIISCSVCWLLGHRQSLHQQLHVAKLAADASVRCKSEFLANMSHEVRTPLNGIIGMTDLALDCESSQERREHLATVRLCAESLLCHVQNILDFSEIQDRTFRLQKISFHLDEIVAGAVHMFAGTDKDLVHTIRTDCSPSVPAAIIGDPDRLMQILVSLLANAVKFSQEGELVVRIAVEERMSKTVVLHFSVSDAGAGIPPEKQDTIFQAFNQADNSPTRQHGGIGLGLAICRRLVNLMGGHIWLESQVGRGSTFHFTANFLESSSDIIEISSFRMNGAGSSEANVFF